MVGITALYCYAYLVGAAPTAYLIGKLVSGIDIREYGSGNVGGTNVFYHVGKWWVVPLGFFEIFIKGASPLWIGYYYLDLERSSPWLIGAPLLAIAGHNWSIYLRLQGGRGIAVVSGALLGLSPLLLAIFILVAMAGWFVTRSSGVWVLISLALLPLWAYFSGSSEAVIWTCSGILVLVVLKRVTSNWTPFTPGLARKKVLFNRIFRDRDLDKRDEWVTRTPSASLQSEMNLLDE